VNADVRRKLYELAGFHCVDYGAAGVALGQDFHFIAILGITNFDPSDREYSQQQAYASATASSFLRSLLRVMQLPAGAVFDPPVDVLAEDRKLLSTAKLGHEFVGRQAIMTDIQLWLSDAKASGSHRALLILGDPGVGKSALAVHLFQNGLTSLGSRALLQHVCSAQPGHANTLDPAMFVRSLVAQLARNSTEYCRLVQTVLRDEVSIARCKEDPATVLVTGVLRPLSDLAEFKGSNPLCLVVDSLDESLHRSGAKAGDSTLTICKLLSYEAVLGAFPPWLRLIATSRRDHRVTILYDSKYKAIDAHSASNQTDLATFVRARIADISTSVRARLRREFEDDDSLAKVVSFVCSNADGNFLVAFMLCKFLTVPADDAKVSSSAKLPKGLSGQFRFFFELQFGSASTAVYKVNAYDAWPSLISFCRLLAPFWRSSLEPTLCIAP
jgi:hypothetical protein